MEYIYGFKVYFTIQGRECTEVISGKIVISTDDINDIEANAAKKCIDTFGKHVIIHDMTKLYLGRSIKFTDPDAETSDS